LRWPDPSANPYLAYALMLMAGLDGIKRDLPVPTPTEENPYQLDQASLPKLCSMPGSLGEAIVELAQTELVEACFGANLFEHYVEGRKKEWDEYRLDVSQWELDRYLPIY
jgi:glutamine synthetase